MSPQHRHRLLASLAALATAGVLTLGVPAIASAEATGGRNTTAVDAQGQAVDRVKQACTAAVDRRLVEVTRLNQLVADSKALTDEHRSALTSQLTDDTGGLDDLKGQIGAATELTSLRGLCQQIVERFRVYVLQVPKVHLTVAADREVALADRLDQQAAKLSELITRAQDAGKDVKDAPALLADLRAGVGSARAGASGVAGAVVPLTPAEYDGGSAQGTMGSARGTLQQGRTDLERAHDDAVKIVQVLQSAKAGG